MRAFLLLVSAIVASAAALGARDDHEHKLDEHKFDEHKLECGVGGISDFFDKEKVLHHNCECPKGTEPTFFFEKEGELVGKLCARKHHFPMEPKPTPHH